MQTLDHERMPENTAQFMVLSESRARLCGEQDVVLACERALTEGELPLSMSSA